jgi:hypothetical protein
VPRHQIFPQQLLDKHPDLTKKEIRAIAKIILNSRANKLRMAYIVDFRVPFLGRFRSHGNKTVRRKTKALAADRKRKKELTIKKQNTKEYLLW